MTPNEFRHIREGLGLTQTSLARRLGYGAPARVNDIEHGRMGITPILARLMRAYEIIGYAPDYPNRKEG